MDKGFYSEQNVDALYACRYKFSVGVLFTTSVACSAVEENRKFTHRLKACYDALCLGSEKPEDETFIRKYFTVTTYPKRQRKIEYNEESIRKHKEVMGRNDWKRNHNLQEIFSEMKSLKQVIAE